MLPGCVTHSVDGIMGTIVRDWKIIVESVEFIEDVVETNVDSAVPEVTGDPTEEYVTGVG